MRLFLSQLCDLPRGVILDIRGRSTSRSKFVEKEHSLGTVGECLGLLTKDFADSLEDSGELLGARTGRTVRM